MVIIKITNANFDKEVLQSDKPVLIDFWASWCGPCQMLSPIIEEVAAEVSDVKIGKINVDEEPQLAAQFGVMSIPTLVVMNQSKVVNQSVGYIGKEEVLALIGKWIAPIFRPLGFEDWRTSTALITGFTAKEAVVSTMSVLFGTSMENLSTVLSGVFTPVTAVSFLVFTLLYTPCVAAIAAIRRELGSGLKAAGVAVTQCAVAWVVALVVYQGLNLIF